MKETGKGIFKEFKTFIERGNVIDLAVGVIIGTAFSAIVNSIVSDIMMPFMGVFLGGINFSGLSITIGDSVIHYGLFINNVINFLIIALCVFFFVKLINKITNKKEDHKEDAPSKSEEVILLEEIRDELKKKNAKAKK